MINERKLQIYAKYSGDIDGWVRVANGREVQDITDQDWKDIGDLLQRISIVKRGDASAEFEAETRRRAMSVVENSVVLDDLWQLA